MKKIVIFVIGYSGLGNVGADARLQVILEMLKKNDKKADIEVMLYTYHHLKIQNHQKVCNVNVASVFWKPLRAIWKSDVVIISEGIPFKDKWSPIWLYNWLEIIFVAGILKKKVIAYSIDIDGLGKFDTFLVKKIVNFIDCIITRSQASYKKFKELDYQNTLIKSSDISLCLKKADNETISSMMKEIGIKPKKKLMIVSIKNSFGYPIGLGFLGENDPYHPPFYYTYGNDGKDKYNIFITELAKFLNFASDKLGYQILFVEMEHDIDYKITNDVYSLIQNQKNAQIITGCRYCPSIIKGIFSKADIVLSSRLHSLIFSLEASCPAIGLSEDDRFQSFLAELNKTHNVISCYDTNLSAKLVALIKKSHDKRALISRRAQLLDEAKRGQKMVFDILANIATIKE